jgi:hypothetical protein
VARQGPAAHLAHRYYRYRAFLPPPLPFTIHKTHTRYSTSPSPSQAPTPSPPPSRTL